jgi:cell division septal protein FtsQ
MAAACAAAAVGAYAVARASPLFALTRVEIRGAPAPLAGEIQRALQPLQGESLLAFSGGQADGRLASIPEVASASYDRAFPHTLRVTVKAEHAVAVLRQGSAAWVAASSGRVLAPLAPHVRSRLPRVWLPASTVVLVGHRLTDAAGIRALRTLWGVRRAGFHARIRFARASSRELTLVLRSGVELRLGEIDRLGLKLAIATRLLPAVQAPPKGPPYLDLTVPERPVASESNPQVASYG